MSSWVGEIHLGPRVLQPQSFLGRGQLVSLEETLEEQVTPLPQVRQATVGHPHPRTLAALALRPHPHFDSAAVQGYRRTPPIGQTPSLAPKLGDSVAEHVRGSLGTSGMSHFAERAEYRAREFGSSGPRVGEP